MYSIHALGHPPPLLEVPGGAAPHGTGSYFLDLIAMAKQLWDNPSNEVGVRKSRFLIVVLYCTDLIEMRRCAGICLAQRLQPNISTEYITVPGANDKPVS